MSILQTLGKYVVETCYDDLSPKTIECAKIRLLDYLGTAFHASGAAPWKPLINVLRESGQTGECTVIGDEIKLSCAAAAMVNTYPHMSEGSRFAGGHCAWIAMPAALAAAEHQSRQKPVSGKDLILAIVLSYEIMLRIGIAIYPAVHKKGFQTTTVRGPIGAAVAAAKLFGFDAETTTQAMAIAASLGGGLEAATLPWQFYCFQIGRANESGILAAFAANAGLKGNKMLLEEGFLKTFGDSSVTEEITADLNSPSLIENTYIKIHFGCRHAHPAMDACLDLMRRHQLTWQDLEQIRITTYPIALDFCSQNNAQTISEASYDMKTLIALVVVYGNEAMRHFRDDIIKSEPVQKIVKLITLQSAPELEENFPQTLPALAEITTKDKRIFTTRRDLARGEPEDPLTTAEIEEKFNLLTYHALDNNARNALIHFVNKLPEKEFLIELFDLMGRHILGTEITQKK